MIALYVGPLPRPLGALKLLGAPLLIVGFHAIRTANGGRADFGWTAATRRALMIGFVGGALLYAVRWFWVEPAIEWAIPEPKDLSHLGPDEGDDSIASLAMWIAMGITWGAMLEEFVWRGFVMRYGAVLLGSGPRAWTVAWLVSSIAFGLAHVNQGPRGIASTMIGGLGYGAIYLATGRRSLWPVILAHALTNTTSFILDHLGYG